MWPHVSTNYMAILRAFEHIKPKLELRISFWVRRKFNSVNKAYKCNLKVFFFCLKIIRLLSIKEFYVKCVMLLVLPS